MAWMIVSDSSCEIRELKNPAPGVQFALVPFIIRVGEREYVDLATLNTQQMLQEMGAEEAEKRMADRKKAKLPPVPPDYPEKEWIEAEYGFEGVYEETPFDDTDYSWTPKLIYQYLGEHVYGQEEAKRGAAMLVYNHLQGHRRNMLVAGPTGCGKTEIWRTLQKKFSFIKIINGPQLSCDGWKGSYHVKDIFL